MRFLNYYAALKNKRRAFTLLELLIVLLIIGILIALGLYKYQSVVNGAGETDARTAVRAALINAESVYSTNNESYGTTTSLIAALGNRDGLTFVEMTPTGAIPTGPSSISTKTIGVRNESTKQITLCSQSKSNRYYCIRSNATEVLILASATAIATATNQLAAANPTGNLSTSYGIDLGVAYCRLADPATTAPGDVCTPAQAALEGASSWPGQAPVASTPAPTPASAGPVAGGNNHNCAITTTQTVKCWGVNGYGQLGDGTTTNRSTAVLVPGITTAVSLALGDIHSCARLADGTVKCWGGNFDGELGNGTLTNSLTPVSVIGITTAVEISAGQYHTCARLADGTIKCWGYGGNGQLGNGASGSFNSTPVVVTGISTAAGIGAGENHTCARLADGTAKCWGRGTEGELGNATIIGSSSPVIVSGLTSAAEISAGNYHTCARLVDGSMKCWGDNGSGQLGDGTLIQRTTAVSVIGISTAAEITLGGGSFTCARLTDGTVKCWGFNNYGQLGNGTTTNSSNPVLVTGITTATGIASGTYDTCAILADNTVKCWGFNNYGQLGNNTLTASASPVAVVGF